MSNLYGEEGAMSYNRDDAVSYASTHWQTNCHDGVISIIGSASIFTAAKKRELGLTPPSAWSVKLQPFTHPDARGALVTEQENRKLRLLWA